MSDATLPLLGFGLLVWAGLYLAARNMRSWAVKSAGGALLIGAALPAAGSLRESVRNENV